MSDEGLPPDHDADDYFDPAYEPSAPAVGDERLADEAAFWQPQDVDGLCAPTSAAMVVSEFQGSDVDKDDVARLAAEHGLITYGTTGWSGMTADATAQLLHLYGVSCRVGQGDLENLSGHLADNHGVILAVDSGEIWGQETGDGDGNEPDHALVVTMIDEARGVAVLNDPGDPSGAGREIPLAVLEDAWADSGNLMVVTDAAPGDADREDDGPPTWVILPIALVGGGTVAAWMRQRRRAERADESEQAPRAIGGPSRLAFGDDRDLD